MKLTERQKTIFKAFDGGGLTLFDYQNTLCLVDRKGFEVKIDHKTFEKFVEMDLIVGKPSRVLKGLDYKLTHKGIRLILELTRTF